ncbi:PepSY-like domain-containing protein [Alistipes putredinis]|uniref:PepSY-like domain-containing protein n=1 Tax=Alistipes putredinis TaxID=28117 RepID=UPI002FDA8FE7
MKKIVVLFVSMLVLATTASAGNDKPIQVSQMPQTAQQFIKKYFGDRKVAFAKEESDFRKSYEIAFKNGDKIEFDRKGEWTDIDCKYSAVPTGIIPAPIAKYVADNYPDNKIVQIERDTRSTEVKLDNRMEIKFDKQHRVIEMDF